MIHKKCNIASLALGFSFKQNNDDKTIQYGCCESILFKPLFMGGFSRICSHLAF